MRLLCLGTLKAHPYPGSSRLWRQGTPSRPPPQHPTCARAVSAQAVHSTGKVNAQIQQHRSDALPAVLRVQLVVEVVEMGLPSKQRQRSLKQQLAPSAHLVFLPNLVVEDLDAFTVVCTRSASAPPWRAALCVRTCGHHRERSNALLHALYCLVLAAAKEHARAGADAGKAGAGVSRAARQCGCATLTHSLSTLLPDTLSTTEDLVNSGLACATREHVTWAYARARAHAPA